MSQTIHALQTIHTCHKLFMHVTNHSRMSQTIRVSQNNHACHKPFMYQKLFIYVTNQSCMSLTIIVSQTKPYMSIPDIMICSPLQLSGYLCNLFVGSCPKVYLSYPENNRSTSCIINSVRQHKIF